MEKAKIPAKTKELAFQKQGEIYILSDLQDKKSFNLDPISFLVWVQIDGKTPVNTIVDVFSVSGNKDIIKAWYKAKGTDYSDEYIEGRIIKTDQEVNEFYERRHKELDELLKMSPFMYWVAFKDLEGVDYNEEKSIPKNITLPMIEKIYKLARLTYNIK